MAAPEDQDDFSRGFNADYFKDNFNTKLSPDEEAKFQGWLEDKGKTPDEMDDYDMRGAWKSGADQADNGHFPDTFKKPNHPTFSVESQYNGEKDDLNGGTWQGGRWGDGTFTPSQKMLDTTQPASQLKDYMNKYEPDYKLVLPNQDQ